MEARRVKARRKAKKNESKNEGNSRKWKSNRSVSILPLRNFLSFLSYEKRKNGKEKIHFIFL